MTQGFNDDERRRYSRHVILPEVGEAGQRRLREARVALVGVGGLGSPIALYLAAAGVGTLGLIDFDDIDLSNLHRQVIHATSSVGRPKIESARAAIAEVNPNVRVIPHSTRLSRDNALDILRDYDFVVDGTDNFATRYLVNDACVLLGKTNLYGSIFRFEGQATVFCAPGGPCYRCLFPEPPPLGAVPSCAEAGVLGVLPGVIGLIQATETVKAILGVGDSLVGRLVLYDALAMTFQEIQIARDPNCPICGDHPTLTELSDYEQLCGLPPDVPTIAPSALRALFASAEPFALIDVREPDEFAEARIEGSTLIPLGELESRLDEVPRDRRLVVHCHSGFRSAKACSLLIRAGFPRVENLRGGIVAWREG